MSPGLTDVETWLCCLCIDEAKHIELYFSLSITSHQLLLLVVRGWGELGVRVLDAIAHGRGRGGRPAHAWSFWWKGGPSARAWPTNRRRYG